MTNPAQETGSRRDMLRRRVGSLLCVLLTLTIGFAGVQGFIYLQLPLPWMLGAMFAVLSGAVIKMPLQAPRILLSPMRAVLGLMIGSAFTPQLLHQIDQFLISLVFVFPYIAILALIGVPYYRLLPRFNFPTAFFAAMPGGLAEITVLGSDVGADTRKLALVHSTRLLILLFTLPFLVETLIKVDLSTPRAIGPSLMTMDWTEQAILLILGMFGWLIAKKLHMSGASLVGPMLLSAAAHLSGIVQSVPPGEFLQAAQWVLGVTIGCAFLGITLKEFTETISHTLAFLVMVVAVTYAFAWTIEIVAGVSFVSALLAFAPGGQAEMSLVAAATGVNVAYVAVHHLIRIFLVLVCAPPLFSLIRRHRNRKQRPQT